MATLPQASDYGARVGLRSNRIDLPGQGELAVANALERAAGTFVGMAIEHKEKDDAISYSNAKNEYLIADIQEREKLQDDQDFATHDERYRTAMKGHYERLFPTVRSARDQQLFDAEARLMNERGSVAVGDNARTKKLDWNIAQFERHGTALQGVIMAASDAQTAQDAMFGYLEEANSLLDRGLLTPTQHEAATQTFVTDTAERRLIAMDPKEREILLERSITMAKTRGEPITREQIAAGEGSGSIADFMPLDVRVQMLEQTRKANEIDETLGTAQGIFDEARALYSKDSGAMMEEIRRLSSQHDDPKVRQEAVRLGRQYRDEAVGVKADKRDKIMTSATEVIMSGEMSFAQIPAAELAILLPHQIKALQDWQDLVTLNKQFPNATRWILTDNNDPTAKNSGKSYAAWSNMTDEEKMTVPLDSAEWRTSFKQGVWRDMKDWQDRLLNAPEKAGKRTNGLTNPQMVTSAIVRMGLVPQTGRDVEESQSYQMLLYQMDRATQAAEIIKGEPLDNTERDKILGEILVPVAFTDNYMWFPDLEDDDKFPIAAMSVKQRKTGRLAWTDSDEEASISSTGISTSYKQELELLASKLDLEPDQEAYERAYFALKHGDRFGWGGDEVEARLRDE